MSVDQRRVVACVHIDELEDGELALLGRPGAGQQHTGD